MTQHIPDLPLLLPASGTLTDKLRCCKLTSPAPVATSMAVFKMVGQREADSIFREMQPTKHP
jgi:hypothetical protein